MIGAAILSFGLAVTLGLVLAVIGVRYQRGSLPLAALHASVAVLGLALLLWQVFTGPTQKVINLATLLFVLALLGGLVLLALRVSKREYRTPPPMFVVVMHAIAGVFALLLLVVGYMHS